MLKLLVAPLLFITLNSTKKVVVKKDFEKSKRFVAEMREKEKIPKTSLFIKNLEYQLIYDSIEINYSLGGCFNYSYFKMNIKKTGDDYYLNFFTIQAPDMTIAEEKYLNGGGEFATIKLTPSDLVQLKNALVENKKCYSTMHNYISIKQGDVVYELMDSNPKHPLIRFIEAIQKRKSI
jgi:hypothetical protein